MSKNPEAAEKLPAAATPPVAKPQPPPVPTTNQKPPIVTLGAVETTGPKGPAGSAAKPVQPARPKDVATGTSSYDQVLVLALTRFNRDQQLMLAKTLAGVLGGHLTFPEARENRVRNELLEIALGSKGTASKPAGKPSKVTSKAGEKKSKIKAKNPTKPGSKELRSSPEAKRLADCQKAIRDKRVELGIPKGTQGDPRLQDLTERLEQAKKAYFEARDLIRGRDL